MSDHRHTTHEHEHEFEAAHGLPEPLPAGERILWQGAPVWHALARHCFHVRKLAVYFGAILAVRFAFQIGGGAALFDALIATVWLLPLAAVALGMALLMAFLTSRTSVYTITDQRVVMRVGIVLSLTFNLPFKHLDGAALHLLTQGAGDIALSLDDTTQIAYVHLWPHARPWRVKHTQPMLRALPNAAAAAQLLTCAWAQARGVDTVSATEPARQRAPVREPERHVGGIGGGVAARAR